MVGLRNWFSISKSSAPPALVAVQGPAVEVEESAAAPGSPAPVSSAAGADAAWSRGDTAEEFQPAEPRLTDSRLTRRIPSRESGVGSGVVEGGCKSVANPRLDAPGSQRSL